MHRYTGHPGPLLPQCPIQSKMFSAAWNLFFQLSLLWGMLVGSSLLWLDGAFPLQRFGLAKLNIGPGPGDLGSYDPQGWLPWWWWPWRCAQLRKSWKWCWWSASLRTPRGNDSDLFGQAAWASRTLAHLRGILFCMYGQTDSIRREQSYIRSQNTLKRHLRSHTRILQMGRPPHQTRQCVQQLRQA